MALTRRIGTVDESLSYVRVYLDEIEDAYALISGTCESVTIDIGEDYKAESPADLSMLAGRSVSDLTIRGSSPSVSVVLTRGYARVSTHDEDVKAVGLAHELAALMRKRRQWIGRASCSYVVAVVLLSLAVYLGHRGLKLATRLSGNTGGWDLTLAGCSMMVGFIAAGLGWISWSGAVVILQRRSAGNFWIRNRDQLIVGALLTVMGAAIGVVLTKAFG